MYKVFNAYHHHHDDYDLFFISFKGEFRRGEWKGREREEVSHFSFQNKFHFAGKNVGHSFSWCWKSRSKFELCAMCGSSGDTCIIHWFFMMMMHTSKKWFVSSQPRKDIFWRTTKNYPLPLPFLRCAVYVLAKETFLVCFSNRYLCLCRTERCILL